MKDISGFGIKVQVLAIPTFPAPFTITQFADDADPFDIPSIQIADKAMGLNGELIVWSKANPIVITLNVIPTSDEDKNLNILLQANRAAKGKRSTRDLITLTAIYPDGQKLVLAAGKITDGMPALGIQSSGRMKSKSYAFVFENYVNVQ